LVLVLDEDFVDGRASTGAGDDGEFVGSGGEVDGGFELLPVVVPAAGVGKDEGADFLPVYEEVEFAGVPGILLGVVDVEVDVAGDTVVAEGECDGGTFARERDLLSDLFGSL
jgi:hypothetical protein